MKISKAMTVRSGLGLICAGTLAGLILRFLMMLNFFDYSTSFYSDGGLTAWLSLILPLAAAAAGGAMCSCSKRSFSQHTPGRAVLTGAMAIVTGAVLIYTGITRAGALAGEGPQQSFIRVGYIVTCFAFGLVQFVAGFASLSGSDTFLRLPMLYLPAILWGMGNLVMVYVFYAKFSSVVENCFTILGGAALLLALLYMTKLRAGVEPPASTLRLFIAGGLSAVLVVSYQLANLVLGAMGRTYFGEMPADMALCELGLALYVLVFMLECYHSQVDKSLDDGLHRASHFEGEGHGA